MKLLYVGKSVPGLSETFIRDEMRYFRTRGHSVHLICQKQLNADVAHLIENDFFDDVSVVGPKNRFQKLATKLYGGLRRLSGTAAVPGAQAMARHLNALDFVPDAMIAHFGPNVVLASHVKQDLKCKPPLIGFFHGYDISLHTRRHSHAEYVRHAGSIDRFIAISDHGHKALRSFGISQEKIKTIHLGVNQNVIPAPSKPKSSDALNILSVGRLVEKKGFDSLIDAFATLPAHILERAELTIIGNGPQREQLLRQAKNSGLGSKVHILGALSHSEVLQRIADASVFVLASRTSEAGDMEGIPVVLMEAMAAGTPVVATRHAGIPELIEDGVSGLLVPESEPRALAMAVSRMAEDFGTQTLIRAARERIQLHFNREIQNHVLENEILDLVANRPALSVS